MFQASFPGAETKVEETYGVAMLLAACGGFLDAFTYLGHGHVFANAMTGNVVLLGVFAAAGNWAQSLAHLYPILAFLSGVAAAEAFRLPRFLKWMPHAPLASLTLEILFLAIAGAFPRDSAGTLLVLGISFVAALQSSSFRRAGKWTYNSTLYAALCISFVAGAVAGGLCTLALDNRALWIVDAALLAVWLRLSPRCVRSGQKTSRQQYIPTVY